MRALLLGSVLTATALGAGACASAPDDGADDSASAINMGPKAGAVLLLPFEYLEDGKPSADHNAFADGARALAAFYKESANATVVRPKAGEVNGDPTSLYRYLEKLAKEPTRFDRVIILAHGGVDGPLWDRGQIGYDWPEAYPDDRSTTELAAEGDTAVAKNFAKLVELGRLIRNITTAEAVVYLGQCNPGRKTSWDSGDRTFVEAMACLTGRKTAGRIGTTSATDAVTVVKRLERADVPKASNFAYANDTPNKCTSLPAPRPLTVDPSTGALPEDGPEQNIPDAGR